MSAVHNKKLIQSLVYLPNLPSSSKFFQNVLHRLHIRKKEIRPNQAHSTSTV